MARIIVMTDTGAVTHDERSVRTEHLADEHTSLQLLERVAWGIADAEGEQGPGTRRATAERLIGSSR